MQGKKGSEAKDKSTVIYNNSIVISDIPPEVQEYVVNRRSALDWLVERCGVRIDKAGQGFLCFCLVGAVEAVVLAQEGDEVLHFLWQRCIKAHVLVSNRMLKLNMAGMQCLMAIVI